MGVPLVSQTQRIVLLNLVLVKGRLFIIYGKIKLEDLIIQERGI